MEEAVAVELLVAQAERADQVAAVLGAILLRVQRLVPIPEVAVVVQALMAL